MNSRPAVLASLVLASSLLAPHLSSLAAASAQANVEGGPGQQVINIVGNDPALFVAETSAVSGDSTAYSYANMITGVLRDFARATNAYPGTPYAALASGGFFDTVTFSNGVGQTAYLDWSFDGSLSLDNTSLPFATHGQLLVYGGSGANIQLTNAGNLCATGGDCTVGTSVNKQGSIPFVISAGAMFFAANLSAYSQYGNTADFSNTGRIYLRTPDGVSYTSQSGQFLNEAAPIFAVPEPATYALMLAGLVAVGLVTRRRSRLGTPLIAGRAY